MVKNKKPGVSEKVGSRIERVSTYIPGFDELIQNGFEKNSVNLVVGTPGSGKTIFAMQFLVGGMKKGEKCLYVTFEEKKEEFYSNMETFGWELEEYEKQGFLTFLEYTPAKVKTMLEEGGGEIESIISRKKITRVVIDSVTSFALLFDSEIEKRQASLGLFNLINSWGCTSILTYEVDSLSTEHSSSSALEFEADSIINMYFIITGSERKRFIEIIKMRGTKHSTGIHETDISEKGINVSIKPSKVK